MKKTKRASSTIILPTLIFLIIYSLNITSLKAQTGVIATGLVMDETLGNVLQDFRAEAEGLLISGEVVADRQIRHAANQLLILSRELEIGLAKQLDKALNQLDESTLRVVNQLNAFKVSLENSQDEIVYALDELTLDLERILGNTFVANHPFLLKRVIGFNHLYRSNDNYRIELIGSNFGSATVKITELYISGENALESIQVNNLSQNRLLLNIDYTFLNQYFDINDLVEESLIKTVPVELSFQREDNIPWWNFWSEQGEIEILNHKFYLYLIPNNAGRIYFTATGEGFEWRNVGKLSYSHRSISNHCQGDCDTDDDGDWEVSPHGAASVEERCVIQGRRTPTKEGDQYLVNAAFRPNSNFNSESVSIVGANGFSNNCLRFEVSSFTHDQVYNVTSTIKQYVKLSDPIELDKQEKNVQFGNTYQLTVPKNTSLVEYSFDPLGPERKSTGSLSPGLKNYAIEVLDVSNVGEYIMYSYRIPYPGEIASPSRVN